MSIFSKPIGLGRTGIYNWGGTAVGAGVGAAMAGEDHRTSGAVVGGVLGNVAGLGMTAAHVMSGSGALSTLKGTGRTIVNSPLRNAGSIARTGAGMAIKSGMTQGYNINHNVAASVRGIMGRFR